MTGPYTYSRVLSPLFLHSDAVPTFVLMDIQGTHVVTYVYQLHGEEVKVTTPKYAAYTDFR